MFIFFVFHFLTIYLIIGFIKITYVLDKHSSDWIVYLYFKNIIVKVFKMINRVRF